MQGGRPRQAGRQEGACFFLEGALINNASASGTFYGLLGIKRDRDRGDRVRAFFGVEAKKNVMGH